MASLTIASGELAGRQVELPDERFVLGRSSGADLQLEAAAVSGKHCVIVMRGDRRVLQDLDSTNGTQLNGSPIREAFLKSGDRIGIGDAELVYDAGAAGDAGQTVSTPAFAARKSSRWHGILVILLVAATTVLAAGWFIVKLLND